MSQSQSDEAGYRFDGFHLLPHQRRLLRGVEPVDLTSRAIGILIVLAERFGRVVSRDEILDLAFPGVIVEPGNIAVHINQIRKVLGPAAITTVPGVGYRFSAKLDPTPDAIPKPSSDLAALSPLPFGITPLIGRETELRELCELIRNTRLVTIAGPGGVGKTKLALALGNSVIPEFADGVRFVDLAPIADAALVETALLTALGIVPGAREAPRAALLRWLGAKRVLMIFDNCEYAADGVAALIETLLAQAPALKLVATSQVVLGIAGETIYRLDPLALPPLPDARSGKAEAIASYGSVKLFVSRIRAVDRRFHLEDANAASIAMICRLLEGIPLALEMAASRLPLLGIAGLWQRLAEPRKLLTTGPRSGPARQRTLESMLEWSYGLLDPDEQLFFRRLGIFRGSFSLAAALAIGREPGLDEWALTDLLGRLIDKSIVVAGMDDPPRYRLLETLRLDAAARLKSNDEQGFIAERHLQHYVRYFDRIDLEWQSMPDKEWIATYAPELENARAALDWALADPAQTTLAVKLAAQVGRLWYWLGLAQEGRQYMDRLTSLIDSETPPIDAARFLSASASLLSATDRQHAMRTYESAAKLFRQVEEPERLGLVLMSLAQDYMFLGRFEDASIVLDEAWRLLDGTSCSKACVNIKIYLGMLAVMTGDLSGSKRHLLEVLRLTNKHDSPSIWNNALLNIADVSFQEGNIQEAIRYVKEAIDNHRTVSDPGFLGAALANLASYLALSDSAAEARIHAGAGLSLLEQRGGIWLRVLLELWALLAAVAGRHREAAKLEGFVAAEYEAAGEKRQAVEQRVQSQLLQVLLSNLSAHEIENLHAEGSSWTAPQAVEFTKQYLM